jgi:hypothetical protein
MSRIGDRVLPVALKRPPYHNRFTHPSGRDLSRSESFRRTYFPPPAPYLLRGEKK